MMPIADASDVQKLLAHLDAEVDPLTLTHENRAAALRLADRSHAALNAGLSAVRMWADHEPLEGLRP